jgi:hypothetical protein
MSRRHARALCGAMVLSLTSSCLLPTDTSAPEYGIYLVEADFTAETVATLGGPSTSSPAQGTLTGVMILSPSTRTSSVLGTVGLVEITFHVGRCSGVAYCAGPEMEFESTLAPGLVTHSRLFSGSAYAPSGRHFSFSAQGGAKFSGTINWLSIEGSGFTGTFSARRQ